MCASDLSISNDAPLKLENEIFEKYGDVELKFDNYYKNEFGYVGNTQDGEIVYASVGGESIYKLKVSRDKIETLKTLQPNYINITKDNKDMNPSALPLKTYSSFLTSCISFLFILISSSKSLVSIYKTSTSFNDVIMLDKLIYPPIN